MLAFNLGEKGERNRSAVSELENESEDDDENDQPTG